MRITTDRDDEGYQLQAGDVLTACADCPYLGVADVHDCELGLDRPTQQLGRVVQINEDGSAVIESTLAQFFGPLWRGTARNE